MEQSEKRIRLIDVLRGFAIIGTLGTNIWLFAQPGNLLGVFVNANWWEDIQSFLQASLSVFVNGKFLSLLTILFGIGLELKYRKTKRDELPWIPLYLWTMALLFIDGFLHFVFVFEYDVLMSYALTGGIVAFMISKREKLLKKIMMITGFMHLFGVVLVSILCFFILKDDSFLFEMERMGEEISSVYQNQPYWQQVHYRVVHFIELRAEAILILFMNITLYLVGIHLYRAGAFLNNERGRVIRKKLMIYGLGIGIPLNLLALVSGGYFDLATRYIFAPVLALGYIGLFAWVLHKKMVPWIMKRFEAIGKTALSCYILQNIFASLMFYGWGFNLAPVSSVYVVLLCWLFITIIMMVAAELFVTYLGTGPLEYVWKKLSSAPFKNRD